MIRSGYRALGLNADVYSTESNVFNQLGILKLRLKHYFVLRGQC